MDANVRTLILLARKDEGENAAGLLNEAYELLKKHAETEQTSDAPDALGADLYILCAETAFKRESYGMCQTCVDLYLSRSPPANQFLCRAYLTQAQLIARVDPLNPEQLEKACMYITKAVNFAKEVPRYHFLVYNGSVLYWSFCRPFLKPRSRRHVARGLHLVVKALDDIDDPDHEWRAQLMIALVECHLDAGRQADAAHIASVASHFIKQNVPKMYRQIFGLVVRHQLADTAKIQKDIKSSPELAVYFKVCHLKAAIENKDHDNMNPLNELNRLIHFITKGEDVSRLQLPPERGGRKSPISPRASEAENVPHVRSRRRPRTPSPIAARPLAENSRDKPRLLLELSRLALDQKQPLLCQECIDGVADCTNVEASLLLELEFVKAELMVRKLGPKQDSFIKGVIDVRLQAVKHCEEAVMNAIRYDDADVIQAGCVSQWNLCLPLLQSNLRQHVRRPLTMVAEALEDMDSLWRMLRCQIHTEIAKCEEDQEQVPVAMQHLRKALSLDDECLYTERLETMLHRLELRSQLYQTPDRAEDQAAMIIEQARHSNTGTLRMKRALLCRAGEALAPDAFILVLDSESDTKASASGSKGPHTAYKSLSSKAQQFNKCVLKAEGHLKRLGAENDRERVRLWADLAKTARRQQVWDVCRVACRFCLLYDDGRWKAPRPPSPEITKKRSASKPPPPPQPSASSEDAPDTEKSESPPPKPTKTPAGGKGVEPEVEAPPPGQVLYERDLIRLLAEVHFINGESLIHLLRGENVELLNSPVSPEDRSKKPKGFVAVRPEEDPDWNYYCQWISDLSCWSVAAFLRGMALGQELAEPWIVCCAATYVWNYANHILQERRHRELAETLQQVYDALVRVGHAGETQLLTSLCTALATAYILPWLPKPPEPPPPAEKPPSATPGGKKKPGSAKKGAGQAQPAGVVIDPEAGPDLKRALEVCTYAIDVTSGVNPQEVVPVAVRHPLLQTWVLVKQMLQQQIGKTLGCEDVESSDGQKPMTRSLVAVEMLSLNSNGIMDFKDLQPIPEVLVMVESCDWSDKLVELQLWTRLAYISYREKDHDSVAKASQMALRFAATGTQTNKKAKVDSHKYTVEQEMLSYAACLQGQSLCDVMAGSYAIRRQAMDAFIVSVNHGRSAKNYVLTMTAARHYWNAIMPLVSQPIERDLLKKPLQLILESVAELSDKKAASSESKTSLVPASSVSAPVVGGATSDLPPGGDGGATPAPGGESDDLAIRAAMYGVLFQSFADKGEWEAGIRCMDEAIDSMPRTNHRLVLFKHRVIVKAKLGRSVMMDLQKFKDESESDMADMWRKVALCSRDLQAQLVGYQNAIESLRLPENVWQKYDYLLEFGQWLYVHDFPTWSSVDLCQWAADLLLNLVFQAAPSSATKKRGTPSAKGKKDKGKKPGKKSPEKPAESPTKAAASAPSGGQEKHDSDAESEMPAGLDYIPVAKKSQIGVLPTNPAQTVDDLVDVRQLEGLVRAHVLMAQIAGRQDANFLQFVLMAHGFVTRIWKVSLSAAGPVVKELAKNPPPAASDSKAAKGGKKDAKKEEPVKERPKRKGPIEAYPGTVEDWGSYDAPDEILEAFKQEAMKASGINQHTFTKAALSYHYLDLLATYLRDLGYNHLALPVLALCDVLSRSLVKNRALNALVHIKSMEVCLELNLLSAVTFHQTMAGPLKLVEDEQAQVRDALTRWREQKVQVAREEARVQESMASLAQPQTTNSKHRAPSRPEVSEKAPDLPAVTRELGPVKLEEVWVDTAEGFMRQGMYQPAREMLKEAFVVAEGFDNFHLKSRILFLMGKMAHAEAQHGLAAKFCRKAQDTYKGDEMFWYGTTMLLVDCIQKDTAVKEPHRQARGYLRYATDVFKEIADARPNKTSITGYILTKMDEKFADIQTQMAYDKLKNMIIAMADARQSLESAHQKYVHCADRLLTLGWSRDAVTCLNKAALIAHQLATDMYRDRSDRHGLYLMALSVMQKSVVLSQQIMHDCVGLLKPSEMKSCSLPVVRECADTKLQCTRVMIDLFETYARETRETKEVELKKPKIIKMVEELTLETPDPTAVDQRWDDVTSHVIESAVTQLVDAHVLSASIPRLRAKALCLLGKCLRLAAEHKGPDSSCTWDYNHMEVMDIEAHAQDAEADARDDKPELDKESPEFLENQEILARMRAAASECCELVCQSSEVLAQAVNVSLKEGLREVLAEASLELMEICGQYDPGLAANLLMLYQSCEASLYLESLLYKSMADPLTSQTAALLHQRRALERDDVATNNARGPTMKNITATLEKESLAWRRLSVTPTHLDILKEFPQNFNFVILQHSPDRSCLYAAMYDRPKTGKDGKGSNPKHAQLQGPNRTRIVRIPTSAEKLDLLLARFAQHKQDVMQILLKLEYQRSLAANRQKMLASLGQAADQEILVATEEEEDEEQMLQDEFTQLVQAVEDYLQPLMYHIEHINRPETSNTTQSGGKDKDKDKQPPEKENAATQDLFVLLVDHWLMELPLEALRALQTENAGAICREISLQFMYHRLLQDVIDEAEKKNREKNKPPSRIPGLRDAGLKKAKVIPLDRSVPQGCVPVNTSDFRYFVDPHLDCAEAEECSNPIRVFEEILEEHSQQFTARWLGLTGKDHIPSVGEYEVYMTESSSVIYYGTEKLLAHISPDKVAALALPECMIAILCDLAQTSKSFLRQSKVDINKTSDHLSLEKPVETALLLSLSGVKCVMANQWACTLPENAQRLSQLARDLLAGGLTTGQSVRLQHVPYRRKVELDDEPKPPEETQEEVEGEVKEPEEKEIVPLRQWYNMVCYGLPNIMVTLLH